MGALTKVGRAALAPVGLHGWKDLKGVGVAGHGGEALVPEPAGRVLGALNACEGGGAHGLLDLLGGEVVDDLGRAGAHDEDVSGAELDALVGGAGLKVRRGDARAVEGMEGYALVFGVGLVVDQHATSDEAAAGVPVVDGGRVLGGGG